MRKIQSEDLLEYNPCSTNEEGKRRWFQSKHKAVNEIIEAIESELDITSSKSTNRAMVVKVETLLELSPSSEDGKDELEDEEPYIGLIYTNSDDEEIEVTDIVGDMIHYEITDIGDGQAKKDIFLSEVVK